MSNMKFNIYEKGLIRRLLGLLLFLAFPLILLLDMLSPLINGLASMVYVMWQGVLEFNPMNSFRDAVEISKDGFLIFLGKKN